MSTKTSPPIQRDMFATMDALSIGYVAAGRAEARNDVDNPGWTDAAVEVVRRFVAGQPADAEWTMEAIRAAVSDHLPVPTDLRVWGSTAKRCLDAGVLVPADKFGRANSSHGAMRAMYRRGPKA